MDGNTVLIIGQALWSWPSRDYCHSLQRYLQYYRGVVASYLELSRPNDRVLQYHEDICNAILVLRENPDASRTEFHRLAFPGHGNANELSKASTLVVKVMFMTNCSAVLQSSDKLEMGVSRAPSHWQDHVPFSKYLEDHFPTNNHPIFSSTEGDLFNETKAELRATKLVKHLGLSLQATYDIRNHLRFNRRSNTLEIFHYSSFLKEQLKATRNSEHASSVSSCIQLGALPRQLLLEVLDSLQSILFPLADSKSKRYLKALVASMSLDRDVLRLEFSAVRRPGEETIAYVHLAERLAELHAEVRSPRPRGWLGRAVERKSGARYMMLATLVGVALAVLLGMASLAVSCYQTWIAYQAWKYPVALPDYSPK